MSLKLVFEVINEISKLLLVVPPTVYVFGVTLLGLAIEKSKQEEQLARKNQENNIVEQIKKIQDNIDSAKKDGDASIIISELESLKKSKKNIEAKIGTIREKYSSIDLVNSVIKPFFSLIATITISSISVGSITPGTVEPKQINFLFICTLIILIYAILKIYKSLKLIQEISSNRSDSEMYNRLGEVIISAMESYDRDKQKMQVSLKFTDKSFPLNCNSETILNLKFKVKLEQGKTLNKVKVWFFIPDGFELINPPESESWRQEPEYSMPNIRTVKTNIGNMSLGAYMPSSIKIKTPSDPGKYVLRYRIYGEGYQGDRVDFTILVD